jgi:hypothetical protein
MTDKIHTTNPIPTNPLARAEIAMPPMPAGVLSRRALALMLAGSTVAVSAAALPTGSFAEPVAVSPVFLELEAEFVAAIEHKDRVGAEHSAAEQAAMDARPDWAPADIPDELRKKARRMVFEEFEDKSHPVVKQLDDHKRRDQKAFAAWKKECKRIEAEFDVEAKDEAWQESLRAVDEVCERILATPAATLEDVAFKFRVRDWYEEMGDDIVAAVVIDLEAMGLHVKPIWRGRL